MIISFSQRLVFNQKCQNLLEVYLFSHWASLVAQLVKNPPVQFWFKETLVQFLGWEDPLEKGTATSSNILAWRIPWTEEPGRLQSLGWKESDTTKRLSLHLIHLFPIASFLYLLEGFICFSYSPSFLKQTLVSYPNEKRLEKCDLEWSK